MKNREVLRQMQRLDELFRRTADATAGDLELQAQWAKYLCVISAGMLEIAIPELYGPFVRSRASPEVGAFATAALGSVRNPKPNRFLEIAGRFNSDWKAELEEYLLEDGRAEAIESIMNNRHLIAHGKSSNITLASLKTYYSKAVEVLEYVEAQCGV